jgi:hypothetical protein
MGKFTPDARPDGAGNSAAPMLQIVSAVSQEQHTGWHTAVEGRATAGGLLHSGCVIIRAHLSGTKAMAV